MEEGLFSIEEVQTLEAQRCLTYNSVVMSTFTSITFARLRFDSLQQQKLTVLTTTMIFEPHLAFYPVRTLSCLWDKSGRRTSSLLSGAFLLLLLTSRLTDVLVNTPLRIARFQTRHLCSGYGWLLCSL
jgi:hypothetical protein